MSEEPASTPDDGQDVLVSPAETPEVPPSASAVVAPPEPLVEAEPSFVYALGQIEPRFPSLSIEKEYAQVRASTDYAGATDREALIGTIGNPENRYLARNMCWVLNIEGLETYILVPRDPRDLDAFINAYRSEYSRDDIDVVIGVRGGVAPPEMCNGLAVPVVVVDLLYSFDRESLVNAIPRPESISGKKDAKFRSAAGALFNDLTQLADNAGTLDEHRALNYLTVRYPQIYAVTTEQLDRNFGFTGVQVTASALSGARKIVDIVFSYTHRETDVVEKRFVRVDVTEQFPFLVTKMSPYYDR